MKDFNAIPISRGGGLHLSSSIVSIDFIDKILDIMRLQEMEVRNG